MAGPGERPLFLSCRVSWERTDQAFFAAGACHVLAWACRDAYPDRPITVAGMRFPGENDVFHVYARWQDRAYDHAGWRTEAELLRVNEEFEGRPVESVEIPTGLAEFCSDNRHRMPPDYWRDPLPRAREYLSRHTPPWR